MKTGIYKIQNTLNGKCYIGSSINFKARKMQHFGKLKKGLHHSTKLQNAWNKYGDKAFIFTPIIICCKNDLLFYEQTVIDGFDACKNGYNVRPTAGSPLGVKQTKEHIEKRFASRGLYVHSKETREKLSIAQTGHTRGNGGRILTEDSIKRMSDAKAGKKLSPEHAAKVKVTMLGKKHSEETRAKISAANARRIVTDETRAKMSARVVSEETKAKMSASHIARRAREAING